MLHAITLIVKCDYKSWTTGHLDRKMLDKVIPTCISEEVFVTQSRSGQNTQTWLRTLVTCFLSSFVAYLLSAKFR